LRLLSQADVPLLRRTLLQDPYYNLFMTGNLESMGIDHELLFYWGQLAGQKLVGIAMRYKRNWCFYDAGGANLSLFAQKVDGYPEDCTLNGRAALVAAIVERLRHCAVASDHHSYYCALPGDAALPPPPHATRRATERDVPALARLYAGAGEMSRDQDAIRFCLAHNRIFVTEVGGQIVSAALTNAETTTMAMVGGVFTPAPWRNRGHASAAMTALCTSLLEDGIQPCLFYDNPAAGTIYRRLGFKDIGAWRMARLRRTKARG